MLKYTTIGRRGVILLLLGVLGWSSYNPLSMFLNKGTRDGKTPVRVQRRGPAFTRLGRQTRTRRTLPDYSALDAPFSAPPLAASRMPLVHQFSGSALHRFLFPREHYLPGAMQPILWAVYATDITVKYESSTFPETWSEQWPSEKRRLMPRDLLPSPSEIPVFPVAR